MAAHAIPKEFKDNKKAYINQITEDLIPKAAKLNIANYIDVFCEKGYFDLKDTEAILAAGAKHGLIPKIHVNQFNDFGGVALALNHNALSVDHLEELIETI